jgi:hypothetical protein
MTVDALAADVFVCNAPTESDIGENILANYIAPACDPTLYLKQLADGTQQFVAKGNLRGKTVLTARCARHSWALSTLSGRDLA